MKLDFYLWFCWSCFFCLIHFLSICSITYWLPCSYVDIYQYAHREVHIFKIAKKPFSCFCRVRPYGFGCVSGGVALIVSIFVPAGKKNKSKVHGRPKTQRFHSLVTDWHLFDGYHPYYTANRCISDFPSIILDESMIHRSASSSISVQYLFFCGLFRSSYIYL